MNTRMVLACGRFLVLISESMQRMLFEAALVATWWSIERAWSDS